MLLRYTEVADPHLPEKPTVEGHRIHEKAEDMSSVPVGRFARRPGDGRIFVMACSFPTKEDGGSVRVSEDEGGTWTATGPFSPDGGIVATDSGAFIATREGTLVAAFGNMAERARGTEWTAETQDGAGWQLPTCVARSLDGGKTWVDVQKLHDEWTGANRDMIQTRDGRIVFTSMKLLHNPGRHGVLTYSSDDDGRTWTASNLIDLGGVGHHDGATEATLVELGDGRLLKYIRTNWGQFWRAFSADGGGSWHPWGPAGVDATSAPGFLHRLQSGRIALVWNRKLPQFGETPAPRGGDGVWSATPVVNYRGEVSIAFSEDECESWSPPVVVARAREDRPEISYPYLFEQAPGELWITASRGTLKMRLSEEDFSR